MSVDNPYYFNNVGECSKSPQSPSSRSTFSFFRKRSSTSKLNTPSSSKGKVFPSPSSDTVSLGGSRRGSLKSLIRSRSTTTTSSVSYSQGIILGECQPCQPSNPTSSSSHFRRRLGSYNESISYTGSDDVFLPDHRSNNFHSIDFHIPRVGGGDVTDGSGASGLRRHSIGTFTHKERTRCGSFSDEVPKMPAPKPPSMQQSPFGSSSLRKGSKCGASGRNMDDILIATSRQSEPAILWANYLKTRFDKITSQRGRIPFNFLHVKIEEGNLSADIVSRCLATKLQIVIICPSLLALPHSQLMTQLSAILRPEKVLGLLLEIDEMRVLDIHQQALPNFKQWRRCAIRSNDQSFIGNVLGIATDILGPALRDQPLSNSIPSTGVTQTAHDAFTVLPRKLRISQNKVVALLTEPLKVDDHIVVRIDKTGEMLEASGVKRRNPYTLQFSVPESCMEVSMIIKIHIEKNGKELGSRQILCESRLRELEQILKAQDSPIEFICQSMGISVADRERLDDSLLQAFEKKIPPNFHLLAGGHSGSFLGNREASSEEYPTLLHFAAKWGLEKLCMRLLDCPGGDLATSLRNINGKTPLDLADNEGHTKLVEILKTFTDMHEFTTMYHYFKGISDSKTNKVVVDFKNEPKGARSLPATLKKTESIESPTKVPEYMEMTGSSSSSDQGSCGPVNAVTNLNYINIETKSNSGEDVCDGIGAMRVSDDGIMTNELRINEPAYYESKDSNRTDDFSQECSNLLESIGVDSSNPLADYLTQPSNRPVTLLQQDFPNYLTHPSNRPVEPSYVNDTTISPSAKISPSPHESHMKFTFKRREDGSRSGTLKRQGSDTSKASVEDELLEILNDFKKNVFTISDAEKFVLSWENRDDVKQNFKDKQEWLKEMRERYDRIQSSMKKPTVLERVKRLLIRSKSHDKGDRDTSGGSTTERPISSLSLQSVSSSSSSGRMSTGSVCSGTSLGDSGTHSDHEDRRQIYNCRVGVPGSLMENYSIPPAPRVVPQPQNEHHYVIFPSNVPVYASACAASPSDSTKSFNHDYLNFKALNTIDEAKETDFPVTVQPIKIQRNEMIYSKGKRDPNDLCSSFRATTTHQDTQNAEEENAKELNLTELDLQTQETIRNFNRTIKECNEDLEEIRTKAEENHPNHDYINLQLNT
ncbi:uncharacterized protein LOC129788072 isoform X2 [Lutzomyia longipalpis]|uniref:uncharacterized protein LOC129788072 isoform X2 n=1 Tax=Lutzomyia longipalpis TaxID=7200 RepID=UPI00248382C7|nr:uncharacterized protein LOC129788072 isoform X2 [Lutzomyia longipalpis]